MSGLKRGRDGRSSSFTRHGSTSSGGISSTPAIGHTISPRPLQVQFEELPADSPPTQNSSAGSSNIIKKGRGVYKSLNVDLMTKFGGKIQLTFTDDMTRAVGQGARELANYCGYVIRTTISLKDCAEWRNVYTNYIDVMILKVKEKFQPAVTTDEEKFQKMIVTTLQNAFRNWKTNLHTHYKKFDTDEERLANPPQTVSFEDWEWLLTYFQSDPFKNKSARNTQNRAKQVTKHTCGPRSFAEVEFSVRDPTTGQPAPPDQVWEITHTRKTADGQLQWVDSRSEEIHDMLEEKVMEQSLGGRDFTLNLVIHLRMYAPNCMKSLKEDFKRSEKRWKQILLQSERGWKQNVQQSEKR